ncbi:MULTISPECIES: hypothetical protein [Salinibaculum]|uniref:hypothetical protein n=1 Tax=Salinibaculum TaxID=2732368 RepID=UPI0030CB93AC
MDESALQPRLDAIERRQSYILLLLVGGYVFAGTWLLIDTIPAVTVWNAVLGWIILAVLASMLGIYRRRKASS